MFAEFKKFAIRGNVVDLAVGVIIGAAFGKIVSTLVAKIITPVIGLVVGGVNFTSLKVTLKQASDANAEVAIEYGIFLQAVFDFIIVAFVIFLVVRGMNNMQKKENEKPSAPAVPSQEVLLLTQIRDSLQK